MYMLRVSFVRISLLVMYKVQSNTYKKKVKLYPNTLVSKSHITIFWYSTDLGHPPQSASGNKSHFFDKNMIIL